MGVTVPELVYTPLELIPERVSTVRNSFFENKTRDLEFRLVQLRKLYWAVKDNEEEIAEACRLDLNKPVFETIMGESGWVANDINFVIRNLKKWAKDESAEDIEITYKFMNPKIRKDPLGCILVIGSFNYPFQLTMGPAIGAIAAGNTVIMKPSENSPHCSAIMQKIFETALDPSCYQVVQGGIEETQLLLSEKWDKIFYTGSHTVGRIIAKTAADTLTPVVLELGGINPAFVTKSADPRLVARRMLWGKTLNAGQLCTSQNYHLVDREILPRVIEEFKKAYNDFYPNGAKASPDYSRIINKRHFLRLKSVLDNSKGKILMGGELDEEDLFIEPTLVLVDSVEDSLCNEETFGPFLTLVPVDSTDEAIRIANSVQSTPLGLYPFGNKAEVEKIISNTRSGGVAVNDASLHIPTLEFGGVGESGTGSYRGRASFDCFINRRPITTSPGWIEAALAIRYPPYASKVKPFKIATATYPDFDRAGKQISFGWLRWLLTLGGGSATGGAVRYATVAVVYYYVMKYLERGAKFW